MKKINIIIAIAICFGVIVLAHGGSAHASSGCGFDSAGDYTCRSSGNLRNTPDPGTATPPPYSGPQNNSMVIPPVPPYTPGDLSFGITVPYIPVFPIVTIPIYPPLTGVPVIPLILCNPIIQALLNPDGSPRDPMGPVSPGGNACSYESAAALVLARENGAFASAPNDQVFCTYQDSGAGCGDAGLYNAIGPGIRLGCNPGVITKTDGSAVLMQEGECTTKERIMVAYEGSVLQTYQDRADNVMEEAAAAGNPVCDECLQNVMVSMAYRGDLATIPGFRDAVVNGDYDAAITAVNNSPTNINDPALADRKQDIIDGLESARSSSC